MFAIAFFVSIGHQAGWSFIPPVTDFIYRYQALIAGGLALIGAVITVRVIRRQIASNESHVADDNARAETAALIKVRKGSEDWRRYLNEYRVAIDMTLVYLRDNIGTHEIVRDLVFEWEPHPDFFHVETHLQRPLQVATQLAMMEFQTACEQLERRFENFHDEENVDIPVEQRAARIAVAWDQMEQALAQLETCYQADLRRLHPNYPWDFLQPVLSD